MTNYVTAWQCIGCGKIEAPQTCVGICQDHKVQFVHSFEHEEVLAQAREAKHRAEALEAVVRQIACTTPRRGEWEHSYRAMQARARSALAMLACEAIDIPAQTQKSTEAKASQYVRQR